MWRCEASVTHPMVLLEGGAAPSVKQQLKVAFFFNGLPLVDRFPIIGDNAVGDENSVDVRLCRRLDPPPWTRPLVFNKSPVVSA